MVYELLHYSRFGIQALIGLVLVLGFGSQAFGQGLSQTESLRFARDFYDQGRYYQAARFAFTAIEGEDSASQMAYAWVSTSLVKAGLYHSASYFFIRALQTGNPEAKKIALKDTEQLLLRVGVDVFRLYLVRHTEDTDYDSANKSAYLYSLGKAVLLSGYPEKAIQYFNGIASHSQLWPYALQLRATAKAILNNPNGAFEDFSACANEAKTGQSSRNAWERRHSKDGDDLKQRCLAGLARSLYQMERFQEADKAYDQISKSSFVWTDILFEQAWNSYSKREFNRALGKLVTYKSPSLLFFYEPEVEVLRALSYLGLCLYSDVNSTLDDFHGRYGQFGTKLKRWIETHQSDYRGLYEAGKQTLAKPLHKGDELDGLFNRFVRTQYFQSLVASERDIDGERMAIARFDAGLGGAAGSTETGFSGFINIVLDWRLKTVVLIGGVFVKNSLLDYYAELVDHVEQMQFIKIEMLKLAKDALLGRSAKGTMRERGDQEPSRRDDQYYWSFNGEFWLDEIGDYVFGLKSECERGS